MSSKTWRQYLADLRQFEHHIALISALAALAAVVLASCQITEARKAAEAQTYLEMRNRFFTANEALKGFDGKPLTEDSPYWKPFKHYWYISFDEWYVTQKLGVFPDLWETYYAEAFVRALQKDGMRTSFCALRKDDFAKGIRADFAQAIEDNYKREINPSGPCT